jgi:hypothetical protein
MSARRAACLTFQLEDTDRFGASEHGIGFRHRRDGREIDVDVPLAQQRDRGLQHRERFSPRKSNFTRPACSTHFVELGHRHVGLRIAVEAAPSR